MICILKVTISQICRPRCCMGILSLMKRRYLSFIIFRKFSILPNTDVKLIFFFSNLCRSTQTIRHISLASILIKVRVISVHLEADVVGGSSASSSSSSTLRGNCVSNSSERICGLGPCASHVLISRKHIWYQIKRRTCVSTGPNPYSVPSR